MYPHNSSMPKGGEWGLILFDPWKCMELISSPPHHDLPLPHILSLWSINVTGWGFKHRRPPHPQKSFTCSQSPNLETFKEPRTRKRIRYGTGPPGYIGWRNQFLGTDSWAPWTFTNMGSVKGCWTGRICTSYFQGCLVYVNLKLTILYKKTIANILTHFLFYSARRTVFDMYM